MKNKVRVRISGQVIKENGFYFLP